MSPRLLGGRIMRRDDAGRTLGRARILFGIVFEQLLSPAHGLCHALVLIAYMMRGLDPAVAGEPHVPCGSDPYPAYAAPGPQPTISLWRADELPADWVPPACTGWKPRQGDEVVALAGRFEHQGSFDELVARAGAFSRQTEILYWKEKKKRWEQLYKASAALGSSDPASQRPDFSPAEFGVGTPLYFVQDDTEPIGPIVHELIVRERSQTRLVVSTRSLNRGAVYGMSVIPPGGLEGFFLVEHETGPIWRYYALTRVHLLIPAALAPPPEDHLNKAVALFRFLAGIPTDVGPPALK